MGPPLAWTACGCVKGGALADQPLPLFGVKVHDWQALTPFRREFAVYRIHSSPPVTCRGISVLIAKKVLQNGSQIAMTIPATMREGSDYQKERSRGEWYGALHRSGKFLEPWPGHLQRLPLAMIIKRCVCLALEAIGSLLQSAWLHWMH